MPTGTKIAAIVLVVLLAAAGLYYAFVPPTPTSRTGVNRETGTGLGTDTTTGVGRPNTLPPAGASGSTLGSVGGSTGGTGLSPCGERAGGPASAV